MVSNLIRKSHGGGQEDFQLALKDALNKLGIHELNNIQKQSLNSGLTEGTNMMVVAPSGSGKTLVGLMGVIKLLADGDDNRKAVFLVPLKALASQQFNYLRLALGNKGAKVAINTGDFSRSSNKGDIATHQILVMTYERFDQIIRSKTWWLKRIKLIVIDEISYLADRRRGPRLEATIVRLKENLPDTQLITLCPPIENAKAIADWLNCRLIVGDERPVPLHLDVILSSNKIRSAVEISLKTISSGGSVIVFTYSRPKSEQIAFSLFEALKTTLTEKERREAKALSVLLLGTSDETLGISKRLASVVEGGVAFHHAGLSLEDRNIVEEGFRQGTIRVVVCTTTLGMGINTPARMVIITDTSYIDVESPAISSPHPFLKRIEPDRLQQMLGRAGRPGYDTVGYGIILVGNEAEEKYVRKTYFQDNGENNEENRAKAPTIESQMISDIALLEQLVIRIHECDECSEVELADFLSKSFWWRCRTWQDVNVAPLLKSDSFDAAGTLKLLLSTKKTSIHSQYTTPVIVRVMSISRHRVEAKVKEPSEGVWIACSFSSKKGPRCECAQMRLRKGEDEWINIKLCNHLTTLANCLLSRHLTRVRTEGIIVQSLSGSLPLDRLVRTDLITIVDDKYRCTELGRIAATLYLHPLTILFIKKTFEHLHTNDELDLESMINMSLRALIIEGGEKAPTTYQETYLRATLEWINEESEEDILRSKAITPGDLHELTEELSRMANAASHVAALLGLVKVSKDLSTMSKRMHNGVKEDLIPLIELSIPSVGRKLARRLYDLGYVNIDELMRATSEELSEVVQLPETTITTIKAYLEKVATTE